MNVVSIVLARMDSTRLPGKPLALVNGRPIIDYCVSRARQVQGLSEVILATSNRAIDRPLVDYAREIGISVYQGNTFNVAKRCVDCAAAYRADYFLRVNGDSPFIDTTLINEGLGLLPACRSDLVTNLLHRTYPYGVSVELVRVETLKKMISILSQQQAEHVTKIYYDLPNCYNIKTISKSSSEYSKCRLVVDTPNDLERFRKVADNLKDRISTAGYETVAQEYIALGS